jgi:adenine-specific DNA methylase
MPQSAIGPGMGVFSRYKAVLESDDSPMTVKAALQLINRELDEYLGGIQGEFDADTRFAITWFEQNGLARATTARRITSPRARGISVESVKHAGIVESAAGKVRILKRDELDADWEPDADGHLTVWECLPASGAPAREIRDLLRGGGDAEEDRQRRPRPCKDLAYASTTSAPTSGRTRRRRPPTTR